MNSLQLFVLAIGISLDGLLVSMAYGGLLPDRRREHALRLAFILAAFHGIMPILGWSAGRSFHTYIEAYDHWVAFVLLLILGLKMCFDSDLDSGNHATKVMLSQSKLIGLSIALSIDALVVGFTLSVLEVPILKPAALISSVVFFSSLLGYCLGYRLKNLNTKALRFTSGIILIGIGSKILIEHLSK